MRDKLIELMVNIENEIFRQRNYFTDMERIEQTVDYLIDHGVTVQADVPDIVVGNKSAIWVLNKRYGDYECSECEQGNVTALHFRTLKMTYCPNCGCKMDLED